MSASGNLDALAAKGARKYGQKTTNMRASFRASKDRAIANYEALPFGPSVKRRYREAWTFMPDDYDTVITSGKENKWREKWIAKMRE